MLGRPLCGCLLGSLVLLTSAPDASASERRFTYTHESGTLAAGERELEPWSTFRIGRDDFYNRIDSRLELEFGLTERLQTAWYLNLTGVTKDEGNVRTTEVEHAGVSWEWKYKLTDPVADAIGTAVYLEGTGAPHEAEIEAKLIVDKRMGKVLVAANLVGEQEWKFETQDTETETILALDLGVAYFVSPTVALGLEIRDDNVIEHGEWEASAVFVGPVVSWSSEAVWAALSVLPQVANLKKEEGAGALDLAHHERVNARLIFGAHF